MNDLALRPSHDHSRQHDLTALSANNTFWRWAVAERTVFVALLLKSVYIVEVMIHQKFNR